MDVFDLTALYCEICLSGGECVCLSNSVPLAAFRRSLHQNGFVQILAHRIDESAISGSIAQAKEFFNKLIDYKSQRMSKDKARRGYSGTGTENFASLIGQANKPNDKVEKFRIGPIVSQDVIEKDLDYYCSKEGRIHFFPNDADVLADDFSFVVKEYYPAVEELCKKLMRLICYCEGLPIDYFARLTDKHTSILSLNYYGPENPAEETGEANMQEQPIIRVAEHTDVSLLTIVAQEAALGEQYGGLEVLLRDDYGCERFERVPYVQGALVVNVGDCLHDWSGGRYKSAMHRVVSYAHNFASLESTTATSDLPARSEYSRYSMAFFYAPNYNAEMSWPLAPAHDAAGSEEATRDSEVPALTYSTWRKNHIKKSMQQLKKNSS